MLWRLTVLILWVQVADVDHLQVLADVDGRVVLDEVVLHAALAAVSRVNLTGWTLPTVVVIF